jgi:hypothetical protein
MKECRLNDLIQTRREWKELITELSSLVYRNLHASCAPGTNVEDVVYRKLESWLQETRHYDDSSVGLSADKVDVFLNGCLKIISYTMDDECPERLIGKRSSNCDSDCHIQTALASVISSIFIRHSHILDEALTHMVNFHQNSSVDWVDSLLLSYFLILSRLTKFALLQETSEDWFLFICLVFEKVKYCTVKSRSTSISLTHCTYRIIFDTFLQFLSCSSLQESLIKERKNDALKLFRLFIDFLGGFKESSESLPMNNDDESVYFLTGNFASIKRSLAELQFRVFQLICSLLTWMNCYDNIPLKDSSREDQGVLSTQRNELLELLFLTEQKYFSASGSSSEVRPLLPFQNLLVCLSDNDKDLIEFLNVFLLMEKRISLVSEETGLNCWKYTFLSHLEGLCYNSENFFLFLISSIFHYDKQVMIDLLTSNETIFLSYFLQFLKFSSMTKLGSAAAKLKSSAENYLDSSHSSIKDLSCDVQKTNSSISRKYFIVFDEVQTDKQMLPRGKSIFSSNQLLLVDDTGDDSNEEIVNDWTSFGAELNAEDVKVLLHGLIIELQKLYRLNLIVFNPTVLCKRIDLFLSV